MSDELIHLGPAAPYGREPGRCIYCGSDGGRRGLTDEHIVEFCLGGRVYLPKASCYSCMEETKYLAGYAGRQIFGPLRMIYGIQSRSKRIDLGTVSVIFDTENGQEARKIPRADLPPILALPLLEPPGLMHERVPAPIPNCAIWNWAAADLDDHMKRFRQPSDKRWRFQHSLKPHVFARLLAKIVHALAVARFGIDSFRPFLPDLILGKDPNAAYLIGGAAGPTDPTPTPEGRSEQPHLFSLCAMAAPQKPPVLVATVRLFPFTGSPTYYVIAGEPTAALLAELEVPVLPGSA
jgi:hypothetical protein